jgi:hypothetical protein
MNSIAEININGGLTNSIEVSFRAKEKTNRKFEAFNELKKREGMG